MDNREVERFQGFISRLLNEKEPDNLWDEIQFNFLSSKNDIRISSPILQELTDIHFPAIVVHKPIFKENGDTVSDFIVSERKSSVLNRVVRQSKKGGSGDHSQVDGSPLKLQEYADLSVFSSPVSSSASPQPIKKRPGITKFGISMKQARYIQSLVNLCRKEVANYPKSFLIFCDGNDHMNTACVLSEYVSGGLKSTTITVKEPQHNNEHLPKLSKDMYLGMQINCKAKYDMFNEMNDNTPEKGYQGSLVVEVEWNKMPSSVLQQPPVESHTVIKAQVTSGDMRSGAYFIFKELAMLQSLVAGLETSEVNWLAEEYDKLVIEKVQDLVERLKFGDMKQTDQSNEVQNNELSEVIDTLVFESRKDLDFTDHLWNILIQCTSYAELVDCFKYVFKVLSNGELQPMIHRNNNTTMAQIVKDSYVDKLRIPNLAGLYPLELLAEMGAEKLKQDYIFIIISKELATLSQMEPFIDTKCELKKKLSCLEKLHNVIEMVVMLKLFLKIPYTNLSSIVLEMLRYYDHKEVSSDHIFDFSVPENVVRGILENCPPCTWQLDAAKQIQGVTECTTHLLTLDRPFDHMSNSKQSLTNGHSESENTQVTGSYFLVKKQDSILFV